MYILRKQLPLKSAPSRIRTCDVLRDSLRDYWFQPLTHRRMLFIVLPVGLEPTIEDLVTSAG